MKYIKLFEDQENPKYLIYDIIIMTPKMAWDTFWDECVKDNPDLELIQNIIEYSQMDVNRQDSSGWTALMWASYYGRTEIVRMLLKLPEIDVNVQDRNGWTVLMVASANGQTEIVLMLLQKPEIDVNVQEEYGYTALIWASEKGHTEIVNLIRSHPNFKGTL